MKKRDLYYERIPTKLLREDIRLLGTFLGRVIKDQEGAAFFKIVERLRLLSKNTLLDKKKSKVFSKISKEVKKQPIIFPRHLSRGVGNIAGRRAGRAGRY